MVFELSESRTIKYLLSKGYEKIKVGGDVDFTVPVVYVMDSGTRRFFKAGRRTCFAVIHPPSEFRPNGSDMAHSTDTEYFAIYPFDIVVPLRRSNGTYKKHRIINNKENLFYQPK